MRIRSVSMLEVVPTIYIQFLHSFQRKQLKKSHETLFLLVVWLCDSLYGRIFERSLERSDTQENGMGVITVMNSFELDSFPDLRISLKIHVFRRNFGWLRIDFFDFKPLFRGKIAGNDPKTEYKWAYSTESLKGFKNTPAARWRAISTVPKPFYSILNIFTLFLLMKTDRNAL